MAEKKEIEKIAEELAKVGRELEEEKEKVLNTEIENVKKRINAMYDPLLKKIERVVKDVADSGNINKVVKLVCYENLGFCCGLEKDCPFRDIVLLVLGIDKEEYRYLKEEFGKMLVTEEGRKKLKEFFVSVKNEL